MEIPLELSFHGIEVTPEFEVAARREARKLERYAPKIIGCRVAVGAPNRRHARGNLHEVRIQIRLRGRTIAITRFPPVRLRDESLELALRDAFDRARRQLQDKVRIRRGAVKTHTAPSRRPATRTAARARASTPARSAR